MIRKTLFGATFALLSASAAFAATEPAAVIKHYADVAHAK